MVYRDLERRIVEAEMELTLAKSQGYLKNQLLQSGSSSDRKLLAVIGVYTGFGSRLNRNMFRGSWMPRGQLDFLIHCIVCCHSSLLSYDHKTSSFFFSKVKPNFRLILVYKF